MMKGLKREVKFKKKFRAILTFDLNCFLENTKTKTLQLNLKVLFIFSWQKTVVLSLEY